MEQTTTFLTKLITTITTKLFPASSPPKGFSPHEEFESKKTTRLGMIFLIIMVMTGIWQGQSLFNAINSSITPPKELSQCFYILVSESKEKILIGSDSSATYSPYSYQNISNTSAPIFPYDLNNSFLYNQITTNSPCSYSPLELSHGVDKLYSAISPLIEKRTVLSSQRNTLEIQLQELKNKNSSYRNSYNTSLFETIAQKQNPLNITSSATSTLESSVKDTDKSILAIESNLAKVTTNINDTNTLLLETLTKNSESLQLTAKEYASELKWLELKRFITSIILLTPLAYFTLRRYQRSKNERSEFAIIWGGIALIATILFSQLIVIFIYRIIPHQLIERVLLFFAKLFSTFTFVLVFAQWLGLILLPLFFGFLIYKIQKIYYNKEAVIKRALKDGKCPKCTLTIKDTMVFCPSCAFPLRKICEKCSHTSISYASYCEGCGTPFKEQEETK